MLIVVQTYSDDSCWSIESSGGVHFIQNGKLSETLASTTDDEVELLPEHGCVDDDGHHL